MTTIIMEIIAGIQSGENIHHQDHVTNLNSLRSSKIINTAAMILVSKENSKSFIIHTQIKKLTFPHDRYLQINR